MTEPGRSPMPTWPRLLDIHLAAQYLSLSKQAIYDYVAAGILTPVSMPGCLLRSRTGGQVIARPEQRRMAKILLDKNDLDRLIDAKKAEV
jgi:hypothetical protein